MTGMTFDRGTTAITVTLDAEKQAWKLSCPNPDYTEGPDPYVSDYDAVERHIVSIFGMGRSFQQPEVNEYHIPVGKMLTYLTPDECRLMVGHCSHLCEHSHEHMMYLTSALTEAAERKDCTAINSLTDELHNAVSINMLAKETALALLEVEVVT